MKRQFILIAFLTIMASAFAEGYQVNALSAKQVAMGHTGVAQKLNSESAFFNPAGLGFMDKTIDLSLGVTGIFSSATSLNNNIDGLTYKSNSKVSTPLYLYAGFRVYDNFKVGLAITTPYGSAIEWGDNWAGAVLNQSVKLQAYNIQPTFAWRITPKLSVGAGLIIGFGNVNLNKGLVVPSSCDLLLQKQGIPYSFGSTTPASVNLKGSSNVAVGFNVGAMYDISDKFTIGANFRSKLQLNVKSGDASLSYANEIAVALLQNTLGILNESKFAASMPMPYSLTFGVSYRPTKKLELAFDAQLTGWSAYKNLYIDFLSEQLKAFNQDLPKNYKNSWAYRLGAKYDFTNRFTARAGLVIDTTPVNPEFYNPETPGMTKVSPSLGFSFKPIPKFSIDLAVSYVGGTGKKNVSYEYTDLILQGAGMPPSVYQKTFTSDYKASAVMASIGFSLSF